MRPLHVVPAQLRALGIVLGASLFTLGARGHAPQTRSVAVTPDAGSIAVSLPGFGIVYRAQPSEPFVYVCDALLGVRPADVVPSLSFLEDGTLLVGSASGLRSMAKDGCPRTAESELRDAPVVALALTQGSAQTAYAVVSGAKAGLWRSKDGGEHWELRAPLATAGEVSAIVVSPADPERLYLSESTAQGNFIRVSSDGGATLTAYPQDLALTLLHVESGERLWAMARDALTVGNRGRAILRADAPQGPWQSPLHVAYFGGFIRDARGVISIGDELGGVYRSDDDGQSFRKLPSDVPVACLAHAGDALYACTPGTLTEPALQSLGGSDPFVNVIALADVDRLVKCPPALNVERVCAAAWVEWQRDVLRLPLQAPDAGALPVLEDAGQVEASPQPQDTGVEPWPEDAAGDPEGPPSPAKARGTTGCSALAGSHAGETQHAPLALGFAVCVLYALGRHGPRCRDSRGSGQIACKPRSFPPLRLAGMLHAGQRRAAALLHKVAHARGPREPVPHHGSRFAPPVSGDRPHDSGFDRARGVCQRTLGRPRR